MNPQVFVIICHEKETDIFEELAGAFTNREVAKSACDNLNKNFPHYIHTVKVLSLQGAVNDCMNHRLYCFSKKENE